MHVLVLESLYLAISSLSEGYKYFEPGYDVYTLDDLWGIGGRILIAPVCIQEGDEVLDSGCGPGKHLFSTKYVL